MPLPRTPSDRMRVGINLLTDDPNNPSGAHWFWTRVIPEMATMLTADEELVLLTSPKSRPLHDSYRGNIRHFTLPWSNEKRSLRTLSEHSLVPFKLRKAGITQFNTLMAPLIGSVPVVAHIKTLHAYTAPASISPPARLYRRLSYPRTARVADIVILNSESLRREVQRYLDIDPAKLRLIPEAVDHELFRPGDRGEAQAWLRDRYDIDDPFVLFVSSLWPYKNCAGLMRAFAAAKDELEGRKLVVVGPGRDSDHAAELRALAAELGITDDVLLVGGVPLADTVNFYRAADVFVYPSFNETFGLPILEAMACGCPVVTSDISAMPETAGGAALLADPNDVESIANAVVKACGPEGERLRQLGLDRAGEFTWARTAERTLAVYREVHARHSGGPRR